MFLTLIFLPLGKIFCDQSLLPILAVQKIGGTKIWRHKNLAAQKFGSTKIGSTNFGGKRITRNIFFFVFERKIGKIESVVKSKFSELQV